MPEIGIEQPQFRLVAQMRGDLAAHRDQCAGATGRHVHPPQQFLPGRIGGLREGGRGFRRAVGDIALRRRAQRRSVGLELGGEIALEAVPIAGVESAKHLVQLPRDQRSRCLTTFGQQRCRELLRAAERRQFRVGEVAGSQADRCHHYLLFKCGWRWRGGILPGERRGGPTPSRGRRSIWPRASRGSRC